MHCLILSFYAEHRRISNFTIMFIVIKIDIGSAVFLSEGSISGGVGCHLRSVIDVRLEGPEQATDANPSMRRVIGEKFPIILIGGCSSVAGGTGVDWMVERLTLISVL